MTAMPSKLGEILFPQDPDDRSVAGPSNPTSLLEQHCFETLRERISGKAQLPWAAVAESIGGALYLALDIEVSTILGSAWSMLAELRVSLDRERRPPPTEEFLVPLLRHTIASVHKPGVEVLLDEVVIDQITFELEIALTLEAIVLVIRDGSIVAIRSGHCTLSCSLKFADALVLSVQSQEFELPGTLDLGEGISLVAPSDDRSDRELPFAQLKSDRENLAACAAGG
jgi:hypothetical protein